MNIIIEKIQNNNIEDAINFLASESCDLFTKLNPRFDGIYTKEDSISEYEEIYNKYRGSIYIAKLENNIIGAGYIRSNNYLDSLYVKEEYRNLGIGSKLLSKIILECKNNDIIRVEAEVDAISLYEKFSFKRVNGLENAAFVPMELVIEGDKHVR